MTITFLTANNFSKINGKEKYLQAGLGRGRNVMYWKADENGNIYGRLSPIADNNYDGVMQEVSEGFGNRLKKLLGFM